MSLTAEKGRRQHPRTLVEIAVSLSCADKADGGHIFSVYDISLSGMAIHSDTLQPAMGDTLCLCLSEMRDQCSRDHIIEATVIHRHHGHVGIRFDSVGIHILQDIQRLLRPNRTF